MILFEIGFEIEVFIVHSVMCLGKLLGQCIERYINTEYYYSEIYFSLVNFTAINLQKKKNHNHTQFQLL